MLLELHEQFPQYGFAAHKGYSTPEHLEALRVHGPCIHHRRHFAPVAAQFATAGSPGSFASWGAEEQGATVAVQVQ
jgi:ribonuclease HII